MSSSTVLYLSIVAVSDIPHFFWIQFYFHDNSSHFNYTITRRSKEPELLTCPDKQLSIFVITLNHIKIAKRRKKRAIIRTWLYRFTYKFHHHLIMLNTFTSSEFGLPYWFWRYMRKNFCLYPYVLFK